MGGTRDGGVYDILSDEHRRELEKLTNQILVPINKNEAELARLLEKDIPEFNAEQFKRKELDNRDLEEILKKKLKELKGE